MVVAMKLESSASPSAYISYIPLKNQVWTKLTDLHLNFVYFTSICFTTKTHATLLRHQLLIFLSFLVLASWPFPWQLPFPPSPSPAVGHPPSEKLYVFTEKEMELR